MANVERGEVGITVTRKGEERDYTLKMSMNAAVTLEQKLKRKMGQLLTEASELDFTVVREMVFMLLQKHHSDEIKTVAHAGDFIDDSGGIAVFFESLNQLAEANKPAEEEAEATGKANPPDAQTGTSGDSILTLAESA